MVTVKFLGFYCLTLWPNLKWPGTWTPKDARDNSFQLRLIFVFPYLFGLVGSLGWNAFCVFKVKLSKKMQIFETISIQQMSKISTKYQCLQQVELLKQSQLMTKRLFNDYTQYAALVLRNHFKHHYKSLDKTSTKYTQTKSQTRMHAANSYACCLYAMCCVLLGCYHYTSSNNLYYHHQPAMTNSTSNNQ